MSNRFVTWARAKISPTELMILFFAGFLFLAIGGYIISVYEQKMNAWVSCEQSGGDFVNGVCLRKEKISV